MSAIHCRLLGYTVTLLIHAATTYDIVNRLQVTTKDPVVADFATLQTRFLTIWTFVVQVTYALLGLTIDVSTLVKYKDGSVGTVLNPIRETFFAALVWPSSVLVPCLFWPLYHFDASLVFPPFIDKILSTTNNHFLHTAILPIALWELVFLPRSAGKHAKNLGIIAVYLVAYLIVLIGSYIERGTWLYPFLGKLYGTIYLPVFILTTLALIAFLYAIQWPLTRCIWGEENKLSKKQL